MRACSKTRPGAIGRRQRTTGGTEFWFSCVYARTVLSMNLLFPCIFPQRGEAAQPLETETARFVEAGTLRMEVTFEFQTSSQGKEYMVPLAFTYCLRHNLEVVVEPVVYSLKPQRRGKCERIWGY